MQPKRMTVTAIDGADPGYYIAPDGKVLKELSTRTGWGYKWTKVRSGGKQKSMFIHRMLASAYVPNPDGKPQVNHKNGNKLDNRIENLEWVTPSENTQHAHRKGLVTPRHQPCAMLDADGRQLRTFYSIKEAGEFLKASGAGISRCLSGQQKTAYGYRWLKIQK